MKHLELAAQAAYDLAISLRLRYSEANDIRALVREGKAQDFKQAAEIVADKWLSLDEAELTKYPNDYWISTELCQFMDWLEDENIFNREGDLYRRYVKLDTHING